MKKLLTPLIVVIIVLISYSVEAQQYLILEKAGTARNFKYQVNDEIVITTIAGSFTIRGEITQIKDSSFVIDTYTEIKISNIQAVQRTRKFIRKMSGLFFIRGGIAYLAVVGINSAINNESPVIDQQTAIISATMIATGFALKPLIVRKYNVGKGWRLKILDFDQMKAPGINPY